MPNATEPLPETDQSVSRMWPRELLLGLMPLLIGFQIIAWIIYLPISLHGFADFRTLYASAYMMRTHHGNEIYDTAKLLEFKERLAPLGRPFPQPMDHPAYENILFLPLSYLPYRTAFLAFALVNFAVLGLCSWLLQPTFLVLSQRWKLFPTLLFLSFFPITRAITQGQDSVFLLALLVGALVLFESEREFSAGLLTGAGFFKFQIVIPIALLFILWKRWRFSLGFTTSAITALLISWFLVGTQGARQYASILMDLSLKLRTEADVVRTSASPLAMLNLRGLISAIFGFLGQGWIQALVVASSVAVLVLAARRKPSVHIAVVAAALISYHLYVQDASILIIPIGYCLCSDSRWVASAAVASMILPISSIMPLYGFLGGIAPLVLFLVVPRAEVPGIPSITPTIPDAK